MPLYITRNQCTQRNEANALGLHAVKWNTRRNLLGEVRRGEAKRGEARRGEAMQYKMFVRLTIYSLM